MNIRQCFRLDDLVSALKRESRCIHVKNKWGSIKMRNLNIQTHLFNFVRGVNRGIGV